MIRAGILFPDDRAYHSVIVIPVLCSVILELKHSVKPLLCVLRLIEGLFHLALQNMLPEAVAAYDKCISLLQGDRIVSAFYCKVHVISKDL